RRHKARERTAHTHVRPGQARHAMVDHAGSEHGSDATTHAVTASGAVSALRRSFAETPPRQGLPGVATIATSGSRLAPVWVTCARGHGSDRVLRSCHDDQA